MLGETLSHYRILEKIGEGGMGVIYRAIDTRLARSVALKVLRPESLGDADRKRRFDREARAASALNHPNIVTIYDIGNEGGIDFIAMEYLEGESLQRRLAAGPRPLEEVLRHARGVAEALAAAHAAGIVHRDVKPANVMLTRRGQIKVLDFGLAKITDSGPIDSEASTRSASLWTREGVVLGTVAYMSPEQAEGKAVDSRSDVFSFGVMLYELLCGQRPFQGASVATLMSAILRDPAPPARRLRPDTPADLDQIVLRCLEKDPAKRYASAGELSAELARCAAHLAARGGGVTLRRPVVVAVLASLFLAAGGAAWLWLRGSGARWAREEALPEIDRLTELGDNYGAYRLAREAAKHLGDDPRLQERLTRVTYPVSITTEPMGADVYMRGYATPDAPWDLLGRSPLKDVRRPYALVRLRISKDGFQPFEGAPTGVGYHFKLDPQGTAPELMVRVSGGTAAPRRLPPTNVDDFWLDRYEVTNRRFKRFLDAGGYEKREGWPPVLDEDGRALAWPEAVARFRDATGRPGPATWELGTYPDGRDEYPVGGVSWYEAAAFCTFEGKSLPTVYHWYRAAGQEQFSDILGLSNFGTQGPAPVGSRQGLGPFGTYDMAGNVKEWCWNATGPKRYILGGGWGEPTYTYEQLDARSPLERAGTHGFRCARYGAPPDPNLLAPVIPEQGFEAHKVLPDGVFEAFRGIYAYDHTDLKATSDAVDDTSPYWRKEKVSFDAAYARERVSAYLFLPRNAAPPYQAVVWYPGGDAYAFASSQTLATPYLWDFIPRSGRVLVYPVYQGFYERRLPRPQTPRARRDLAVQRFKDLGRTLDYLGQRPDIDGEKLAYYGLSLGATLGPVTTALEGRFKASVLLSVGSIFEFRTPEMQPLNFAPRSRVPTLQIGGRDDFICPPASCQRPLFGLLGTPERDKRHVLLEGGHLPPDRTAIVREVLDWLDRYLGPVRKGNARAVGDPAATR